MKELRKRRELEDMLITHKPKEKEKNKIGREEKDKEKEDVKNIKYLERMKRKLFSSSDPNEREVILNTIMKSYGNDVAEEVIRELRLIKRESETSTSDSSVKSDMGKNE